MSHSFPEMIPAPEVDLLSPMLDQQGDTWTASFRGLKLRTALQPIYSISHKRTVGYEALIRAFDTDNSAVLPLHLFELPDSEAENLLLDRLCRYLHIRNYSGIKDQLNWLFLNVSPRVVTSGSQSDSFFGALLEKTGLPPHRIVMEIVEQPTDDAERLKDTVAYYRKLGCLIAIDDFGAGHSNFERIWNLSPDIVKLDRTLLTRATEDQRARQILNGMVSLLHQSGCLVLLEGVETRDQAMIAIDAGVDFVQGFYFRRPCLELEELPQSLADLEELLQDYKKRKQITQDPTQQLVGFFSTPFRRATEKLQQGQRMLQACFELLNHPTVSRCYLVDDKGVQIADTLVSDATIRNQDLRFLPLENTTSADWFRQQYLRQALAQPGNLHVTTPYLCVTGAYMCVTLSLAYQSEGRLNVLCCDILANTDQTP
ncbi:EAL domain-containing protein [Marinobacter halophilus]|uniref:EAL domain-containing protein n=1 Tax=Marinobacter halophilus TaxID=1323740 RepID=A0A2T1KCR1_9GAMM|nr:EAL domain-containing protein [Marinobacter halophilus]PSF07916.1 EAL domain-containing protein [Marinobacter halophilus]GGC58220.1 EAL domain-containing protein [Marinobacter halophilus]